jgi:hypothetical protein
MTAEKIKKNQLTKPNKPGRPKNPRTALIVKTATEHPDLTTREIGAIANCSHVNVVETLKRYGINKQDVDNYKTHRADIIAGLQHRLLKSVTDEDIKKAPLGSRILAAAQLYDKERLETGKTTGNLAMITFQMPSPDPVPDEYKVEENVIDVQSGGQIEAGNG